ncbi:MAG: hypothetical protein N3E50_04235 [Candidatus Goldbacteria bacterium]|nr:hypothetical protein [Candidatus Goldiibacteriota bacterium]
MIYKKKIAIILFLLFIPFIIFPYLQGSQYKIAQQYADADQIPVVFFDPEDGSALGYLIYSDIDGEPGDEIIIAYRSKKSDSEREEKASIYKQYFSVDVVRNGKKIRGFIEAGLTYSRTPQPYITVEKIIPSELPKIFLMIYDGIEEKKVRAADRRFLILYNGFDENDKKRKNHQFLSVKMPWRFILFQFSETPTINLFETKIEESTGRFYIKTLDENAEWPKIPMSKIRQFEEDLRKYQPHIYWEFGH